MSSETNDNDRGTQEFHYQGAALTGLIAIEQLSTERLGPGSRAQGDIEAWRDGHEIRTILR